VIKRYLGIFLYASIMVSSQALADKSSKKIFQDAYASTISQIISNADCFSEDLELIKPTLLDDDGTGIETYQTRLNTDIFVDYNISKGGVTGATITTLPLPKKPEDELRFICISAAVQSTIDKSNNLKQFESINAKKLSSLDPNGRNKFESKNYEHDYYSDSEKRIIQIDKNDE